ncbi:hypothetical protein SPFM20_00126 [Salmonella phage SPFM20]|nr:hypothetical protein SPFM20_00126 [Salmonella phage SPFM20]
MSCCVGSSYTSSTNSASVVHVIELVLSANGYDNATPWYYRSNSPDSPFGDLPTRSGGSPTDSSATLFDGEWHNTFASLFRYAGVVRRRLGDYSYGHSTYLSSGGYFQTTNQRRTFNKDGYEYVVRLPYQQGLAWGTDDYGFPPRSVSGRILFIPDTVTRLGTTWNEQLIGFNAWNQAPTLFHKFVFKGYFGTLTNEEFILNHAELNGGDFPMTGPGPQELIRGDWHRQYRIVAVKGTEKVMGLPIVQTLPGNTTTYEDKTTEAYKTYYRYDNPRQSVNPVAPGEPIVMSIILNWKQQPGQTLDSIEIIDSAEKVGLYAFVIELVE